MFFYNPRKAGWFASRQETSKKGAVERRFFGHKHRVFPWAETPLAHEERQVVEEAALHLGLTAHTEGPPDRPAFGTSVEIRLAESWLN